MQPLHKTGLLLLAIVLLPALVYAAFEVHALSRDEAMIANIYDQQLETILHSVNQRTWDVVDYWAITVNRALLRESEKDIHAFLAETPTVEAVILADTLWSNLYIFHSQQTKQQAKVLEARARKIPEVRENAARLLHYKKSTGFRKMVPLTMGDDAARSPVILLFVSDRPDLNPGLVGLVINLDQFISNVLAPKMQEAGREQFSLAFFAPSEAEPVYATGTLTRKAVRQETPSWVFPGYSVAIGMSGTSIEDIIRERFTQSFFLLSILVVFLLTGAWIVFRNVRREMELARMKSDFVSNISHDLRTPLALIRMYAETLEMGRVPTEEKRHIYYKIIGRETERLTGIVGNILRLSRIEAGKKLYASDPVNLSKIARDVLETYSFHLEQNGFTTVANLGEALPPIRGDRDALAEVVTNLLDNAIKYSDTNRYIEINTGRENGRVFLEVADHGIGIPPEEQQKVFDKFYRVSSKLVRKTRGTGLGLSLVKHIVQAHGGTIALTSRVGEGSRFHIAFPITVQEPDTQPESVTTTSTA